MVTAFNNQDFQNDYFRDIPPIKYYYSPRNAATDLCSIRLVEMDGEYYFSLQGVSVKDDVFMQWGVYDVEVKRDVKEVAQFYADLEGIDLHSGIKNNNIIYYLSGEKCKLFTAVGLPPIDNQFTGYIWEEDDVIGVIILTGEHKEENLDLCQLEKHEL